MSHDDTAHMGFGGALASRVLPRTRTIRRSPLSDRPGSLAGRVVDFAASLAAPSLAQVGVEPSTLSDPSQQTVRPPIDNWLWGEAEAPEPEPAARAPWRPNGSSLRVARSVSRKGLPLTTRRRQNTLGGARTAPGAIARTLLPNTDTSAPIEAPSVLRRSRRDAAAPQQAVPARPRPAAASTGRSGASSATEPAGLPSDLQRLQRMLIRDGLMQPRSPDDEPLVPPPSVQGATRPAAPAAPAASPGNTAQRSPASASTPPEPGGGVRRAAPPAPTRGPGAAGRPAPQAVTQDGVVRRTPGASPGREVADTAPRASSEGRIDRQTVSTSRARRAAAEASSGASASPLTARPAPLGPTTWPGDEPAAAPTAPPPASPFAGPVTPARVAPDPAPQRATEQTVRRDPVVRRNADLGRPSPQTPAAPVRNAPEPGPNAGGPMQVAPVRTPAPDRSTASAPAVLDRGAVDRALAARATGPTNAPADSVVRRASAAPAAPSAPRAAARTATSPTTGDATASSSTPPGAATPDAEAIATVPAADRPDTAGLAVAPAASIAVAERPTTAPADASPRPAPVPVPDRTAPPADVMRRQADPAATPAATPAVARDAAAAPVTPASPTVPRATPAPAAPAPADPAAPRPAAPAVSGRDGFVVRRLGEVADRPDTSALPVRPAVIGAEPDAPAAPITQVAAAAPVTAPAPTPTVRRSPEPTEPTERMSRPDDRTSTDRVTAADLGRLRARTTQPAESPTAVTPDRRTTSVLPMSVPPAVLAGGGDRAAAAGIAAPGMPAARVASAPPATATPPASPASPDVVRRSIDRDGRDTATSPATARDLPAVRPPAAMPVTPVTPAPAPRNVPSAEAPASPSTSITRGLLRRTLDAREPVRRRVAPLASAGLATPVPVATDPASRASAIEAVMHSDADTAASPQPIAERFMTELSRQRAPRPRPLPAQFHDMSHAIAGTPQVRVSTDVISRRALRSVGKIAATVDDVIHLDRPIGSVRPDVIAHELTHVAHRSPEPRFFDDDRPSLEESRAEAVAKVMRSSAAPSIVRRSPAGGGAAARSSDPGTISADSLASTITGGGSTTIRRESEWTKTRPGRSGGGGAQLGSARAAASSGDPALAPPSSSSSSSGGPAPVPAPASSQSADRSERFRIEDHFDRILEMLQDRVLAELERRGGRLRGGF